MTTSKTGNAIFRAASLVMAAFVVNNLIGLVRQMIINRTFGTSAALDAYFAAFRVPDLLFNIIAGGALGSAFIPVFTELLAKDDHKDAWRTASHVINLLLMVLATVAFLAGALAEPLLANILAPGWAAEPELIAMSARLMRIMLISTVIFGLSGVIMGIHHSHDHFLAPAIAPIAYNVGIIVGAIYLVPSFGIDGLAWGVVLGALGHLLLQLPKLRQYQPELRPRINFRDPHLRNIIGLMLPRTLGLAVWEINFWVNTIIATGLPTGSLSALSMAFQIFTFPQAAISRAIATAVFPTFSRQAAANDKDAMRQTLVASLRSVLLLSIPASVGLVMLGRPIIALLFQYRQFDATSTRLVAWALVWYAVGLVSHGVVEIVTRAFYALQDTRTPVGIGVATMLLNVVLSIGLVRVFDQIAWMPHGALALANSIATTLEMIVLLVLLRPKLEGLQLSKLFSGAFQTGIATAVMAAGLWGLQLLFIGVDQRFYGLIGMGVGALIFGAMVLLLRMPEGQQVLGMVQRRLRRSG